MLSGLQIALAITPPGLARLAHRARAERETLRAPCVALAALGPYGGVVRQLSHGHHTPLPHLLDAAGRLLRVLFLDHQAARLL